MCLTLEEFAQKLTGLNTDHAEDQKKLCRLLEEWKLTLANLASGKQLLTRLPTRDLLHMLSTAQEVMIERLGGMSAWTALNDEEKDNINNELYQGLCLRLGKESFDALPDDQNTAKHLFIWTGCGMHKELNSVKGGKVAIDAFWETMPIKPVKLMNRDNEVAAQEPSTVAGKRAVAVSEGGAVKLTSLAGAVFAHKDHKKGQQDTFRIYFERELGYTI